MPDVKGRHRENPLVTDGEGDPELVRATGTQRYVLQGKLAEKMVVLDERTLPFVNLNERSE